ncbi:A24 family peptidase [Rhodopirellula halodulae]|uniref:A24 family peptidase n=1 Tax=Rhodopirellula halodulae TaxID=2894198 RepID=UPI0027D30A7B|nr:prepilin peptidase [Rhodopirellula sp. JC740]
MFSTTAPTSDDGAPTSHSQDPRTTEPHSNLPWQVDSLWAEYLRMLLVSLVGCSLMATLVRISGDSRVIWLAAGYASVLAYLFAATGPLVLRGTLLSLGVLLSVTAYQQSQAGLPNSPREFFCNASVLLAITAFLVMHECLRSVTGVSRRISPRQIALLVTAVLLLAYMIVLPTLESIWASTQAKPTNYTLEEPTMMEHLRIRSAKAAVFGVFAAFGACFGSFLNVVADSAPRGRSVAFRDSACPRCGNKIRRIDNIPLVSYLNLGGKCRDCQSTIPIRYFLVELATTGIFGSLFLYELVTGAANVPSFLHYSHTGILWMILYTKWPVMGLYLFHCMVFCFVLLVALMETDRLRCPAWLTTGMFVSTIAVALAAPHSVPVTLFEQIPIGAPELPAIVTRLLTVLAGASAGWALSMLAPLAKLRTHQASTSVALAAMLLGIALGWQATFTIGVIWLALAFAARTVGSRRLRPRWLTPSMLMLSAAMLHHPAWKWLANLW